MMTVSTFLFAVLRMTCTSRRPSVSLFFDVFFILSSTATYCAICGVRANSRRRDHDEIDIFVHRLLADVVVDQVDCEEEESERIDDLAVVSPEVDGIGAAWVKLELDVVNSRSMLYCTKCFPPSTMPRRLSMSGFEILPYDSSR